jgi:hypothetical protein
MKKILEFFELLIKDIRSGKIERRNMIKDHIAPPLVISRWTKHRLIELKL